MKKFIIFVEKHVESQNAKNRQILNFIEKNKRDKIIKIDDEKTKSNISYKKI